jgi:hypothetical protein
MNLNKNLKNRYGFHFNITCVLQAVWLSISVSHIWTLTSYKEIKVKSLKTVLVVSRVWLLYKIRSFAKFYTKARHFHLYSITHKPPNHFSEDPPYFSLDSPNEQKASSLVIAVTWRSVIIPNLIIKIIKCQQ